MPACGSTGSRSWPTSSSRWSWPGASRARGVTANSLHPGTVRTGYGGDGDTRGLLAFGIRIGSPFFLSPAKGARTSIYLASSPDVAGVSGKYFVKCRPREPKRWAQDPDAARRLWQVSEEMVGLSAPDGS